MWCSLLVLVCVTVCDCAICYAVEERAVMGLPSSKIRCSKSVKIAPRTAAPAWSDQFGRVLLYSMLQPRTETLLLWGAIMTDRKAEVIPAIRDRLHSAGLCKRLGMESLRGSVQLSNRVVHSKRESIQQAPSIRQCSRMYVVHIDECAMCFHQSEKYIEWAIDYSRHNHDVKAMVMPHRGIDSEQICLKCLNCTILVVNSLWVIANPISN